MMKRLPWYREPMVWMVVGGPLVVVLASIATLLIALRHPDPVLDTRLPAAASARQSPDADEGGAGASGLPAQQARNHAASPQGALPKAAP